MLYVSTVVLGGDAESLTTTADEEQRR